MNGQEMVILAKLFSWHETRKQMSHHSIYHQRYMDECIKLNDELVELTGKNYIDYPTSEIENAVAECALLELNVKPELS